MDSFFVFNETLTEFYRTIINDSAVLLGDDGEIKSAISVGFPLFLFKIIGSVVGIPLNIVVFVIILSQPRLYDKPRNIFLLATTFSNLMVFVPALLYIVSYIYPNEFICKSYVATLGLPDIFLLQSIFLSQIDRYVAIEEPLWHRVKVTSPLAVLCVIFCFVLSVFVNKFLYIFQLVQLECHIHFMAGKILGFYFAILFILCIIARVIVFIQTRNLLRNNNKAVRQEFVVKLDDLKINDGANQAKVTRIQLRMTILNQKTLRQLEDLATRTMVAGVTSLIFLTCPLLVFFFTLLICRTTYGLQECSRISQMAPYFKQLSLIHAIYHPIMHLAWNNELFSDSKQPSHDDRRRKNSVYD